MTDTAPAEGIDLSAATTEHLLDMCQDGDQAACQELDRRGIEPPELELDPDPIATVLDEVGIPVTARTVRDFQFQMRCRATALEEQAERWFNEIDTTDDPDVAERLAIKVGMAREAVAAMALASRKLVDCADAIGNDARQAGRDRADALVTVAQYAAGKTIVGLEVDRTGVARLALDGGGAIVMEPDGGLGYIADRSADPCPFCGGSGVRCCEFGADR